MKLDFTTLSFYYEDGRMIVNNYIIRVKQRKSGATGPEFYGPGPRWKLRQLLKRLRFKEQSDEGKGEVWVSNGYAERHTVLVVTIELLLSTELF